jgi:hypothetical protein
MMKGHEFQSADDIRAFLVDFWSSLDQSRLISGYERWIERLEEVITINGEYYSMQDIYIALYSAERPGGGG